MRCTTKYENAKPVRIMFLPNGLTAVFDEDGKQMAQYQDFHMESIRKLDADGINWRKLEVEGKIQITEERRSKS
jgi:hypothetical protein